MDKEYQYRFELDQDKILDHRFFFFNDTATTEIYTLSLHDALPIYSNDDDDDGHMMILAIIC